MSHLGLNKQKMHTLIVLAACTGRYLQHFTAIQLVYSLQIYCYEQIKITDDTSLAVSAVQKSMVSIKVTRASLALCASLVKWDKKRTNNRSYTVTEQFLELDTRSSFLRARAITVSISRLTFATSSRIWYAVWFFYGRCAVSCRLFWWC